MSYKKGQEIIDFIRGKRILSGEKTPSFVHSKYGKMYYPIYNYNYPITQREPEIYNKNGEKMDVYFIRDFILSHIPYGRSTKFIFDRFNILLDTHIYTHDSMLEQMGNPKRKFGMLIESESIVPDDYKIFEKHKGLEKDFDLIFTYSYDILEKLDNARFVPFCGESWYKKSLNGSEELNDKAYESKSKNISILSSDKTMCDLHKKRLALALKCKRDNLADTFGTFDGGKPVHVCETLEDYRYSITIENDIKPYFFTERITSCFAAMTIPIYCGATQIDKFFNPDGIIQISPNDIDNIEDILKQCSEKDYESRIPAIIDNFNRVKEGYINVSDKWYEDYLKIK